jgi:phage gp29-like protein
MARRKRKHGPQMTPITQLATAPRDQAAKAAKAADDVRRTSQGAVLADSPQAYNLQAPELATETSLGHAGRVFLRNITLSRLASVFTAADTNIADQIGLAADIEESCDHLNATLDLRRYAVLRLDSNIQSGNPDDSRANQAAEFAGQLADSPWFHALKEWLLRAIFHQHAAGEVLYEVSGKRWTPRGYRAVEPARWYFNPEGHPQFFKQLGGGEPFDPVAGRYVLHSYSAIYGQPGRYAKVRAIAKLWFLARLDLTGWGGQIDGWAEPFTVFQYRDGMSEVEIQRVINAFVAMAARKCAAVPEGVTVTLHDVPDQSPHEKFQDFCRRAMSRFLLGQDSAQTAIEGQKTGATLQGQVRDDIRDGDAAQLDASLNEHLFAPLTAWNFGPDVAPPTIKHAAKQLRDPTQTANVIRAAVELGLPVGRRWAYEALALEEPAEGDELLGPQITQIAQMTVRPQNESAQSVKSADQVIAGGYAEAVRRLADECSSYEEFQQRLPELVGAGGAAQTDEINNATFGAYCQGRLETAQQIAKGHRQDAGARSHRQDAGATEKPGGKS